jgi:DNA-binding protein HU-beta
MNKAELITEISLSAGLNKTDAGKSLEAMIYAVAGALYKGEDVTLVGFGTFHVKDRAARNCRNPKTGETMSVPATQRVVFKPGKLLKDAVNA